MCEAASFPTYHRPRERRSPCPIPPPSRRCRLHGKPVRLDHHAGSRRCWKCWMCLMRRKSSRRIAHRQAGSICARRGGCGIRRDHCRCGRRGASSGHAGGAHRLPFLACLSIQIIEGHGFLLSIVQMPAGVPVGTLAIGIPGARNAGLMAAQILRLATPRGKPPAQLASGTD